MAETTTITRPGPELEASVINFLKAVDPLVGQKIDTTKYKPTIADESLLQQFARTQAGGLGALMPQQAGESAEDFKTRREAFESARAAGTAGLVGADAYQAFMSPYQREVIDETLSEFDRQQAIQDTARRDAAIRAGAFGGGREGVLAAEAARGAATARSGLQAQLLAQGFQQAQAAAAAREAEFEPFTRLGLVGQQLAQVQPGAFPTQTVGYQPPAPPVSPLQTALGVGTGLASIGSKLGIFG